jgi:hypothetical protein
MLGFATCSGGVLKLMAIKKMENSDDDIVV